MLLTSRISNTRTKLIRQFQSENFIFIFIMKFIGLSSSIFRPFMTTIICLNLHYFSFRSKFFLFLSFVFLCILSAFIDKQLTIRCILRKRMKECLILVHIQVVVDLDVQSLIKTKSTNSNMSDHDDKKEVCLLTSFDPLLVSLLFLCLSFFLYRLLKSILKLVMYP
jgi:hypothetical protein